MTLTPEQMHIVEENMGLVGKVIKDKVRGIGQPGIPEYNDLFQTGCIGLIKAVATDKGGCLSTYAYRLIWNEISDELVRNTRLVLNEQAADTIEILSQMPEQVLDPLEMIDLRNIFCQARLQASSCTAKGIDCLKLSAQGYSSQEIATILGADSGTVRMWMTRARKHLKRIPELQQYAEAL